MFSKIEFLKIVLGKEATGNMKAPVEPTTLPIAQPHAPLHFVRHTHTHTADKHTTHTAHTLCAFGSFLWFWHIINIFFSAQYQIDAALASVFSFAYPVMSIV